MPKVTIFLLMVFITLTMTPTMRDGRSFTVFAQTLHPPITASLLEKRGEDVIGISTLVPDGVPDVHVRLSGVTGTISNIRVTGLDGTWKMPFNGTNWLVATVPTADPSVVDVFFDYYKPNSSYTLAITYTDGQSQTVVTTLPRPRKRMEPRRPARLIPTKLHSDNSSPPRIKTRKATSGPLTSASMQTSTPGPPSYYTTTGNIYYVATNGSDSNSCAQATNISTPKRNIMGASGGVSCLWAGDMLDVGAGNYGQVLLDASNIANGTAGAPIIIRGRTGETAQISRIAVGWETGRRYIIFDNFVIDNACTSCGWSGVYIGGGNDHITVQNSEIKNSASMGIEGECAFCTFTNLNIHDSGKGGVAHGGYGIYWRGNNSLFEGIVVHDNPGYGIHNYDSGSTAVSNNVYNAIEVYNNGGSEQTQYGIIMTSGSGNQLINSIVRNNTRGVQIGGSCVDCVIDGNIIIDNTKANGPLCDNCQPQISAGIHIGGVRTVVRNNTLSGNPISGIINNGTSSTVSNNN